MFYVVDWSWGWYQTAGRWSSGQRVTLAILCGFDSRGDSSFFASYFPFLSTSLPRKEPPFLPTQDPARLSPSVSQALSFTAHKEK